MAKAVIPPTLVAPNIAKTRQPVIKDDKIMTGLIGAEQVIGAHHSVNTKENTPLRGPYISAIRLGSTRPGIELAFMIVNYIWLGASRSNNTNTIPNIL